ncbi:MAG: hypothetical protein ACK4K3_13545 [Aquabacterium sp.]|jgi:outer membrane protein OmpA-like peptidoglycan-associated protein
MFSPPTDSSVRTALWVVGLLAGAAATGVLGWGLQQGQAHWATQQAQVEAWRFELAPLSAAFNGEVHSVTPVYFDAALATLSEDAQATLAALAQTLRADGGRVVLSGYQAPSLPTSATATAQPTKPAPRTAPADMPSLSHLRLVAVRDTLVQQGVPRDHIQRGQSHTLQPDDPPELASRVDITLVR